ncbi:MAG: hypothetical protein AAGA66_13675, partial [Bacteroidota bacterium]
SDNSEIPLTNRNTASHLKNLLGAWNFTINPSNKLAFSGFVIGFDNDVTMSSNSLRTYPQLGDRNQEQLISKRSMVNRSGLYRFSATYTPSYNVQVDYTFFGKQGTARQDLLQNSQLISGENTLQEFKDQKSNNQNHQVRVFKALDEKNILSTEWNYLDERSPTSQFLISGQPLFSTFLSNNAVALSQYQNVHARRLEGALNYYRILNQTTHINLAFGVNLSQQTLISDLNNEEESLSDVDEELAIANRYANLRYRKKWKKLTVSPGISLNSYTVKRADNLSTQTQYFFPNLDVRYEFGNSHELQLNYNQSLEYNGVRAYAEGYLLNSYNTLLSGSTQLKPATFRKAGLNYRNFNMYSFFNIHGRINYEYITNAFINNQELNGIENVLRSVNARDANHITNGYVSIEKRLDHFKIGGTVNISKRVLTNQFESQVIRNDHFTHRYNVKISARPFEKLSIRAGYMLSSNRYTSGSLTNRFVNHQPHVTTELNHKGLQIETKYTFNRYVNQSQAQDNSFDILDVSLSYRKLKSPWEFKVRGTNLFDTHEIRRDSFRNNLISTYTYAIQQRYGLLTVMYSL